MLIGQGPATVEMHPLLSGAMSKVGFYVPQRLALDAVAPASWKNVPASAAGFGIWEFDGKKLPVVEVYTNGIPSKLCIDETGGGDFASAKVYDWKSRPADPHKPDGYKLFQVDVTAPSMIGGSQPVSLSFYRFDPADSVRASLKSTLLYYANYALDGSVTLGGKQYHAMLVDVNAHGDFDGEVVNNPKAPPSKLLLIDRNGDGKFRAPEEWFDCSKPFNIGGTTYEVTGLHGSGANVAIIKSSKTVAEILPPPPLPVFHAGSKVVSFTATDSSGKTVHFPEDFKGKVVMLDFWATWCGPCMGEVPNVVSVYNQMHGKGFEILGISLDNEQTLKAIGPVTKEKGMTWDQVADGKYWNAAVAKLYGIQSIPAAFIVDGDTGMILSEGEAIRGDSLLPAVQKALGAKNQKPK